MAKGNIYTFSANKKVIETKETTKVNENGEEVVTTSEKEVEKPIQFVIERPSRRKAEEAEVFYGVQLSKAIKDGMLTRTMLQKKYSDTGGALTEDGAKTLLKELKRLKDMEDEFMLKKANKADQKEIDALEKEIVLLKKDVISLEASAQSIYTHTADARAERQTLLWYAINLTKFQTEEGLDFYFKGFDFEEQLDDLYDKDESENGFDDIVTNKILTAIGYWFYSQTADEKDIAKFIEEQEQKLKKDEQ